MLKFQFYLILILLIRLSIILTDDFYAKFHQTDYKIDFQRLELMGYDESIFNFMTIKTFKYNRTLPVVNATLNSKVTMGPELEMAVQFYKFLSNEYRQLRGTNFQINYCKGINANLAGAQNMFKCGNFTRCVIIKGITYELCNSYPDESRFPPFLPNGEYKFEIGFIYRDEIIARLALYVKIYRPITRVEKKVSIL